MKQYYIFSRKSYEQPLTFERKIAADGLDHFKRKLKNADGKACIEAVAIPEDAIHYIVREGKIV